MFFDTRTQYFDRETVTDDQHFYNCIEMKTMQLATPRRQQLLTYRHAIIS